MNDYNTQLPEQSESKSNKTVWAIVGGCCFIFLCFGCLTLFGLGVAGWQVYGEEFVALAEATEVAWESRNDQYATAVSSTPIPTSANNNVLESAPTDTAVSPSPTDTAVATPTTGTISLDIDVPAEINQQPLSPRAYSDLQTLLNAEYPSNDYFETAQRLGNDDLGARTVNGESYQLGDTRSFYKDEGRITAVLMGIGANSYFWVEEGLDYTPEEIQEAVDKFEDEYYGRLTNLFGDVWNPGIDNDPRISILHVRASDKSELGYFISDDEYPRSLFRQSNEQEMVYLNMDELRLGGNFYYGTLIHEVQHLIQWNEDPSEAVWLSEGLSQLAELYLGYDDTAETDDYLDEPDTRLNTWNYEEDQVYRHYASAYLFSVYLWEQLGDEAIRDLSRHPANGLASVQAILQKHAPDMSLNQFLANWAVANYLDNPDAGSPFVYDSLRLKRPFMQETVKRGNASLDTVNEINQYGVHYIDLNDLRGETTITFAGDTAVNLIDNSPNNGQQFWYAPAVNEMNASLTVPFDLTNSDKATLKYNVWHQLEDEYDYAYTSISTDGGQTWELLVPDAPSAGAFGPSYTGNSAQKANQNNGWVKENISLNSYVGNNVLVRWDVLTESSIAEQGFAIDDITIPELEYYFDVETDLQEWQAEGFLPVGYQIPQQWSLFFIEEGPQPVVTELTLNDLNQGKWTLDIGKSGGVLMLMPQTPFVNSPATYWLNISQE